ncbi:MAG: hypothetical protein UGF89_11235 [Acutalibacteraceae bacterium]|nr:hypothetical protein [Acutalibacteraceae bacterium]
MVRKIKILYIILTVCLLLCATCGTATAVDYEAYEGNISSSIVDYAKDLLPNFSINDNYVLFRSGQYTYELVVGDLVYENGAFTLADDGKQYTINTSNYSFNNNYYNYTVSTTNSFSLITGDKIVYSDLGDFPQLEERSAKFEIVQTITLCVACLFVVIRAIFSACTRN